MIFMGDSEVVQLLVLTVHVDEVELVSDLLFSVGARAVEERGVSDQTVELLCAAADDEEWSAGLRQVIGDRWTIRTEVVDAAVLDTWRTLAEPIAVDERLTILPAWREDLRSGSSGLIISIDPGAAFGMGDHPTTRLTASSLLDEMSPGDSVLDMGCGSGILAIVAARSGASAVTAVDIEGAAVSATVSNARLNGVDHLINAVHQDSVPTGQGGFDVICANILAPVLAMMADDLVAALAPEGRLILSGLLTGKSEGLVDQFRSRGLVTCRSADLNGWHVEIMNAR